MYSTTPNSTPGCLSCPASIPPLSGFTLVEINIVLLVIGIGLLALLGLFPVGLRQASLAQADTAQALFAEQVLSALHAKAATITDWNDWKQFKTKILTGVTIAGGKQLVAGSEQKLAAYLDDDDTTMRYLLDFNEVKSPVANFDGRLWRASLRVIDRAQGDINTVPVYCSDFVFMGEPPQ